MVTSDRDKFEDLGEGSADEPTTDCDDSAASSYPGATEIVADGAD